jgi:hypothetical protein
MRSASSLRHGPHSFFSLQVLPDCCADDSKIVPWRGEEGGVFGRWSTRSPSVRLVRALCLLFAFWTLADKGPSFTAKSGRLREPCPQTTALRGNGKIRRLD